MSTRLNRACIAVLAFVGLAACSKNDPPRQPTVPVSITTVKRTTVPYIVTANGVAEAMQTVAIEAQVTGILQRVALECRVERGVPAFPYVPVRVRPRS